MSTAEVGAAKTAFVTRLFARIAPRYDLMNHLMTGGLDVGWRRCACALLAERLDGAPGMAGPVLDVGTGTGDLAVAVARSRPGVRVAGLDLSTPMLALAARKAAVPPLGAQVALLQGNALALPLPDASCSGVVSAFALRNVADPARALCEMRRVVAPGGWVIVLELSQPRGLLFGPVFRLYFHRLVPLLGALVAQQRAAYAYLPASVEAFLSPQGLVRDMEEAGLTDVEVTILARGAAAIHAGRRPGAEWRPGGAGCSP